MKTTDKMELTNKNLVDYFKRPEVLNRGANEYSVLKKYLSNRNGKLFRPDYRNKDYLWLAHLFKSNPALDETNHDNHFYRFYHALKDGKLNGRKFKPEALPESDKDFDKCLCSINNEPWDTEGIKRFSVEELVTLEKWHLFVAWYALEEFYAWAKTEGCEKKWLSNDKYECGLATTRNTGILSQTSCHELLLWMCEASAGSEIACKFLNTDMEKWASQIRNAILEAVLNYYQELRKAGEGQ